MAGNTFGTLFRFTTWGESHGPAIGVVVDGVPPRLPLAESRHPAMARQAAARPVALHDAAPRAGRGKDPVRRVRGADDRHADPADDRECRPALEGLRQHRRPFPAGPRRLCLLEEIRHPRLSRRRPRFGARDRLAGCRRRGGAPGAGAGDHDPRRAGADRTAPDRPRRLGLGGDRGQPVLVPGSRDGGALGRLSRRRAQGRLVGWRGHRAGGGGRAGWAWRSGLRQARRRSGARDDDDQRGQGGRDRRRLRRRRAFGRGEFRRDADAEAARSRFCRTMPAASSAASRPGRTSSCASRSSRPVRS